MKNKKSNKRKWFNCAKLPRKVIKVYDKVNREAAELLKNRKKVNS